MKQIDQTDQFASNCSAVARGAARLTDVAKCIQRTDGLMALKLEVLNPVICDELNLACEKLAKLEGELQNLVQEGGDLPTSATWERCKSSIWEQIYLLTYNKVDQNPLAAIAFVRKMTEMVGMNAKWTEKTREVLRRSGL